MKLHALTLAATIPMVLVAGCETHGPPGRMGTGASAGGGAGAGGMEAQARLRKQTPETYVRVEQGRALSVADVRAMEQARVGDDAIISEIRNSRTVFHLGAADIIDLRNSGVSEKVVEFMINTQSLVGLNSPVASDPQGRSTMVVATPPPPAPVEVVTAAPGSEYVWIDGEWVWNGEWVWVGGHWILPPFPHAVWIEGHWDRGPQGWQRVGGRWR